MPKKKVETKEVTAADEVAEKPVSPVNLMTKSAIRNMDFNIFSDANMALLDKANKVDGFKSMAEVANSYLPVPWLALQYVIGRPGIPVNSIIEFMGMEGVGKSSLTNAIMGNFLLHNIPCLYINSEPKKFDPSWRMRLFNTDPQVAAKIDAVATYDYCATLDEMDEMVRKWVAGRREIIPMDVPLVVFNDSITKMLNPDEAEAAGWVGTDYKDAVGKGVQAISKKPGVTAKWMHAWSRSIAPFLNKLNVTIINIAGNNIDVNSKVAMNPYMSEIAAEKANTTRIGGTAMNQSSAIQFKLTYIGSYKNSKKENCGKRINISTKKNGTGTSERQINYVILDEETANFKGLDVPGKYTAPAILMDTALCDVLIQKGIFGLSIDRQRYSSPDLDLFKVRADEIVQKIQTTPELLLKAASELGIQGYGQV